MVLLADTPKYYWDACAWIALIKRESGRFESLEYLVQQAKDGQVEIWTSNFTLAEVFKRSCDGEQKGLLVAEDKPFEDFVIQDFVKRVQVDFDVGTLARRLLRRYPEIAKPQDAIHLATALLNNIDELHTFDQENLIGLSNKIPRKDGAHLRICAPPAPPKPKEVSQLSLLRAIENAEDEQDRPGKTSSSSG